MKTLTPWNPTKELTLRARTAKELMTPNPVSVRQCSTVAEAALFLTGRGISAAPIIDKAGRPVGVVSRSDMLARYPAARADRLPVHSVMTPVLFCVRSDSSAADAVEMMVDVGVRRLFVVDDDGVLIGVISAIDVLRHLGRRADRWLHETPGRSLRDDRPGGTRS